MGIPELSLITANALTTLQPYLPLIAAKAAEKLGEELPAAVGKLWGMLRKRMDVKEAAKEALDDLLQNPESEAFQTVFKVQLEKILAQDAGYLAQMKSLLQEITPAASYQVQDGALAAGDKAKAVGAGGVLIEGGIGGDFIQGRKKEGK